MKQVLIIDDSLQVRERVAALLAESPQIRIAGQVGNSRDALDAVQRLKPEVVILDIRLPDKSGIKLLKIFKERYPESAVIMLTNLDGTRYRQQCRHLGVDHFLNNTRELEKIIDTIKDNPTH